MVEQYSFFNSKKHDRVYNAYHWADYFYPFFKTGVFNGGLQVLANNDMSVTINPGYAWIDGYMYHLTKPLIINVDMASGNKNRIDNIVLRLDLVNRWIKAYAVMGECSEGTAIPSEPQITSIVHEIVIARINLLAGSTIITQDIIEDTRMDDAVCGWVCGTVKEIEFEQIYTQFKAFQESKKAELDKKVEEYIIWKTNFAYVQERVFNNMNSEYSNKMMEFMGKSEDEFEGWFQKKTADWSEKFYEWFNILQVQLSDNVAGNLQNQIYNINAILREITDSEIDAIVSGTYESAEGGMEPDIYSMITDGDIENVLNNAFGGDE